MSLYLNSEDDVGAGVLERRITDAALIAMTDVEHLIHAPVAVASDPFEGFLWLCGTEAETREAATRVARQLADGRLRFSQWDGERSRWQVASAFDYVERVA